MKARVTVTLKNGVLDPQGQAIEGALKSLAFSNVAAVRQGKIFHVTLNETDKDIARSEVEKMCEKLLANTVIEDYEIEIVE